MILALRSVLVEVRKGNNQSSVGVLVLESLVKGLDSGEVGVSLVF
jgi:hypothetical protein